MVRRPVDVGRGGWRRRPLEILVACAAASVCSSAVFVSTAAAGVQPTQVLRGYAVSSPVADDGEASTLEVNVSFTKKTAEGVLTTRGRTEPEEHHGFTGAVTCVRTKGAKVVIAAFGTAFEEYWEYDLEREERIPRRTSFPGSYMQVVVLEYGSFGNIFDESEFFPDRWGYLGSYGEGQRSDTAASYPAPKTIKPFWVGEEGGGVLLSPAITSPKLGASERATSVTLKGTGEPYLTIEVSEPGHSATTVAVSSKGKWRLTVAGLAVGSHESVAQSLAHPELPRAHTAFTVT